MDQGQLLMTQKERDRLVALKKARKKLVTQRATATELAVSERHVRRLVSKLVTGGDKSVIHGLKGRPSNRAIGKQTKDKAIEILSGEVYRDFGPTLAAEELAKRHQIEASKETVRKWMAEAKLWRPKQAKVGKIHVWRPRRSCYGELVQWDTSTHDWLEGRGERIYLIAMIDATSRLFKEKLCMASYQACLGKNTYLLYSLLLPITLSSFTFQKPREKTELPLHDL